MNNSFLKICLIIVLFLELSISAFSQQGGLRFGIINSTLWGRETPSELNSIWGMHGGLFIEKQIQTHQCIQAEINFIQRGAKFRDYIHISSSDYIAATEKASYITVGALTKLTTGKKKNLNMSSKKRKKPKYRFALLGGMEIGMKVLEKRQLEVVINDMLVPNPKEYWPFDLKPYCIELYGGIEVIRGHTFFDLRFQPSITNIYKGTATREMRNIAFTLTVGFKI